MQQVLVRIEGNQYWLNEISRFEQVGGLSFGGGNGLVVAAHNLIAVLCGTEFGSVSVSLDWLPSNPGTPDLDPWDEIVEVSLDFEKGEGVLNSSLGVDPPAPPLSPGPYRVRVHARGRDRGHALGDVDGRDLVEEHLVQAWPAPTASETRYKLTDKFGAAVRQRPRALPPDSAPPASALDLRQPLSGGDGQGGHLGRGEGYAPGPSGQGPGHRLEFG